MPFGPRGRSRSRYKHVRTSLRELSDPLYQTLVHCADVATLVGDVTGRLRSRRGTHTACIYSLVLVWACVVVIVTTRYPPSPMRSTDCVTEVTLHPSLPVPELYQRLHQHFPSSPYIQGAIYLPVRDATESPSRAVLITKSALPPSPPAPILLLRGDFKWRFGGELEQSTSPPWSWMSEELCGKPYPYVARDFNAPLSVYIDRSKPLPRWLICGASLLTRRSPCVVYDPTKLGQPHCIPLSSIDTATCASWPALRRIISLLRIMAFNVHNERTAKCLHTKLQSDC